MEAALGVNGQLGQFRKTRQIWCESFALAGPLYPCAKTILGRASGHLQQAEVDVRSNNVAITRARHRTQRGHVIAGLGRLDQVFTGNTTDNNANSQYCPDEQCPQSSCGLL